MVYCYCMLFEAGTTVTSLAEHTFPFENFEPPKLEQMSGDGANDSTEMAHARADNDCLIDSSNAQTAAV
jgi:hypothetical protein